jgi:hypothetical protein
VSVLRYPVEYDDMSLATEFLGSARPEPVEEYTFSQDKGTANGRSSVSGVMIGSWLVHTLRSQKGSQPKATHQHGPSKDGDIVQGEGCGVPGIIEHYSWKQRREGLVSFTRQDKTCTSSVSLPSLTSLGRTNP